jgi:Gas vesicle synthesis protein GvpL/GvpF
MISSPSAAAVGRDGLGWYLYGIIAGEDLPEIRAVAGVDGAHQIEPVAEGALAGLASRVSLQEFAEETLPERLGDATWLEQKIRAHEQVLEHVLHDASVLPCRFCSIYRNEAELRRFLSERRDALAAALERVRGKVELGVKAFVDQERFAAAMAIRSDAIGELNQRVASSEGGRAYLERRRLEQMVASEREDFRRKAGGEIHSRLRVASEDGLALPAQVREISGREAEMFFNAAYLVSANQRRFEEALEAVASQYSDTGIDFELTGPWPPYHFVPDELSIP